MASDIAQIEQRLSFVEAALTQVQKKLAIGPSSGNWVDQISGSLADIPEEDYQRFLDHCRAVRTGDSGSEVQDPLP